MNIPQDTLQAVADAAFEYIKAYGALKTGAEHRGYEWQCQEDCRSAVIQHALSNPALAPFLSRGIGEYTDEEIKAAAMDTYTTYGIVINSTWLRSFLAALPAAEDTPPAKVDPYAELKAAHADGKVIQVNIGKWGNPEAEDIWEDREDPAWDIEPEFYRIKPEPAADATTIAKCAINNTEQNVQFRATAGYGTWGAADPEPAAQVPLGPEDVPPGTVFRSKDQPDTFFWTVSQVWERGFYLRGECVDWHLAMERMEINTSIPDTGRWDANAWRPCSKPGKEVAK